MNRDSFRYKYISAWAIFALWMCAVAMQASDKTKVVGLVRDAHTKKPINAAQITSSDNKTAATTDEKGHFVLTRKSKSDILTVSVLDYNTTEFALRGRDSVVIELYSDQFTGYFKNINGVTGIKSNSSTITPTTAIGEIGQTTAVSIDELLQQQFGGNARIISRSGVAGMGASVFVRGMNSLNANAQPLYVVDGVIWDNHYDATSVNEGFFSNPLTNIDVNDIESVTLLKDGNAIYGAKGSNGVILIQTKRANSMVTKINLSVSSGFTTQPGTIPMMTGDQYRIYANELYRSKGLTAAEVSSMPFLALDRSKPIYNTYHNNTNWADQVYQTGNTNNYMINATGGDEKALYYFSLGYTNDKGVVQKNEMQRMNTRFNADIKITKSLLLGVNIGYTRLFRKLQDDGVNDYTSPSWLSQVKSPFLSPYKFTSTGETTTDYAYTDIFGIANPSGVLAAVFNKLEKNRFNISLHPTLELTSGLTLTSQFDYSIDNTIEGHFVPYLYTPKRVLPNGAISENTASSQALDEKKLFDDSRLTLEKDLGKGNHLKAMYGWRYMSEVFSTDYLEEHNSRTNSHTLIKGSGEYPKSIGTHSDVKSLSNYLNVDYDLHKKYFLNAGVSLDGSSRFGKQTEGGISLLGRSWAVFPAVNVGWIVSAENFMKHLNFINFMKLRAGFNVTGNDGIEDYASMTYFKSVRFMSLENGINFANLGNEKIQWETTSRANIGVDLAMLNDRLSLALDFYSGKTTNLLNLKKASDITGLGYYWANGGALTNKGIEATIGIKVLNLKNLKWELGASAGHYVSKITSLPEGDYSTPVLDGEVRNAVGQPVGIFYGYKTKGVFSTEAEAATAHKGVDYLRMINNQGIVTNFGAGDIRFEDKNGDGFIDDKDKQKIGDPNPALYGTLSSKLSVDRLTLSTIFTYSYGNDVYNYFRSQLESGKNFNNQTVVMNNRWTAEGQKTSQPKAAYNDPMQNARFSDRWIEDGSYLRLKTVTLSYDLPLKSAYIEGFNIWVSANNLVTFSKYLGLDPEFSARNSVHYQGVDAGLVPLTKSFIIGFKINL